ncbi:YdbL family protein [Pseudoalteromonas sp. T1lg65]|uniref:YdbL family protein n=1 Tax=Pseudoalteromonas sp. T1lg65 TaxID=2077101 RepID=UPI003F78D9CD
MKLTKLFIVLSAIAMSFAVYAMSLDEAKSRGLVGENTSGYVAVVSGGAEVQQLVDEVNTKRKAKYQELAKKNGISLAQVEALAAKKAYTKTEPGHYIQVNGKWVKK